MQIATGERDEEFEAAVEEKRNPATVEAGKLGGKNRAETTTPERRAQIARTAAEKPMAKAP